MALTVMSAIKVEVTKWLSCKSLIAALSQRQLSWNSLGVSWRLLKAMVGHLGPILGLCWAAWGSLGALLGLSWNSLGVSWRLLKAISKLSWGSLGALLEQLGGLKYAIAHSHHVGLSFFALKWPNLPIDDGDDDATSDDVNYRGKRRRSPAPTEAPPDTAETSAHVKPECD